MSAMKSSSLGISPDSTVGEKVEAMAAHILEKKNMTSPDKTMSGKSIFYESQKEFPEIVIPENSFISYLSNIVHMPDSKINCQGRKRGYYISFLAEKLAPEEEYEENKPRVISKEKLLYEIIKQWLMGQGYSVAVTASNKSHGIWGNPDVTGVLIDDLLGNLCLEIATVEVKLSNDRWQQWIFEAVAHRRFSNRAFFAFAHPDELATKIDPDLRYYCELYQIGAIAIILENEDFEKLINGKLKKNIESDDVEIKEIFSAPATQLPPKQQRKFLKSLGINTPKELYGWGDRIP